MTAPSPIRPAAAVARVFRLVAGLPAGLRDWLADRLRRRPTDGSDRS